MARIRNGDRTRTEGITHYRRLLELAGELADIFGDRDPAQASFILRRAAQIVDARRDAQGRGRKGRLETGTAEGAEAERRHRFARLFR